MRVAAIAASPRLGGNSESLLDIVLSELRAAGIAVEKYRLADYEIKPCVGHPGCRTRPDCLYSDGFPALAETVMEADALVFALPVYYWGVPAQFKAFIDRHVHYYGVRKYKARTIALIIVANDDGIEEATDQMHSFLVKGSHASVPWDEVRILSGYAGSRGAALADAELVRKTKEFGRTLAEELRRQA